MPHHPYPEIEPVWHSRLPALAVALLLLLVGLVYWPGLSGGFLFDDHVNLNALGRYGGVHDLQTLLFYLTSGIADPTGRPMSMASFLLDARDWPADPFPFKRTNLLIHLANGVLLYSALSALGQRISQSQGRARIAALLATALWLANPLWVSTVLYVVQRHAMLAALFVLAGVRAWIGSRNAFDAGRTTRGWLLALLAVPVFGVLAGLSKANGLLLPLLLAVLELSVLRTPDTALPARKWACRLLVWIPAIALLVWLGWHATQIGLDGTNGRPWTLEQRLLTQPRVLCEYLKQLFIPGLNAIGIFADGFAISRDWMAPWTTLPALLAVGTMAVAAWNLRQRLPVAAAALGFFLAGHAIESSVVMLELYFEHRSYLPAVLLFWPLAWWASTPGHLQRWLLAGMIGYASLMLLTTTAQARLWSNPLTLALTWAHQNPNSARAQTYAFHQERAAGRDSAAERRLSELLDNDPKEPQYALNLLALRCEQGRVKDSDVTSAAKAISASHGLDLDITYQWLSGALLPGSDAACAQLPAVSLEYLMETAITEADQSGHSVENRAREQRLLGYSALRRQDCDAALQSFNSRTRIQPRPEFVQTQVGLLATKCSPTHALAHLEFYLSAGTPVSPAHSPMLRFRDRLMRKWWDSHWKDLQTVLNEDVNQANSS